MQLTVGQSAPAANDGVNRLSDGKLSTGLKMVWRDLVEGVEEITFNRCAPTTD